MSRSSPTVAPSGSGPAFRAVLSRARRAARWRSVTVLLQGETGSGKEVIARYVHQQSGVEGPFIAINCGAFQDTTLEAELFGYVKGAFTDAQKDRAGLVEAVGCGTLFLDEVAEMSHAMQVKLLRFLQSREYRRVGGLKIQEARCRILAATHRDLAEQVRQGRFREDLYYRLQVFPITVPPLRERAEDIPDLAQVLLCRVKVPRGLDPLVLDERVVAWLAEQPWRGNVRELEHFIERAAVLAGGGRITMAAVREAQAMQEGLGGVATCGEPERAATSPGPSPNPSPTPEHSPSEQILAALARSGALRESEIIRACGNTRSTLRRPLARLVAGGRVLRDQDGGYRIAEAELRMCS